MARARAVRSLVPFVALALLAGALWAALRGGERSDPPGPAFGVVAGHLDRQGAALAAPLGARLVRHEFHAGTPVEDMRPIVADYARRGMKVLLLAGFPGDLPSPDEARSLSGWAAEFGPGGDFWRARPELDARLAVTEIEFGNETSGTYQYGDDFGEPSYRRRAREYALRFADAHAAIRAAGADVGLLAQVEDGGSGTTTWVDAMRAAVPRLDRLAAGWVSHPYGPEWRDKLRRLAAQTRTVGWSAAVPVWITELGFSSDDGRCLSDNYGWDPCMSYGDAAERLREVATGARRELGGRLAALIVYQSRDQRPPGTSDEREHYFGALRVDGTDKGAYTAVLRELLAQR